MLVVLDTNVLVSAMRSRRGASFAVLRLVGTGKFEIALSVPLVVEYESVLSRPLGTAGPEAADVEALLDYLCQIGRHQRVFYLWRPLLRDPKGDMVLELAVAAGCAAIVTHNTTDFQGAGGFAVDVMTPREFLGTLRRCSHILPSRGWLMSFQGLPRVGFLRSASALRA